MALKREPISQVREQNKFSRTYNDNFTPVNPLQSKLLNELGATKPSGTNNASSHALSNVATKENFYIMTFKPTYQEYNDRAPVDCHTQSVEEIGVDQNNEMYDSERKSSMDLEKFKVANFMYGIY